MNLWNSDEAPWTHGFYLAAYLGPLTPGVQIRLDPGPVESEEFRTCCRDQLSQSSRPRRWMQLQDSGTLESCTAALDIYTCARAQAPSQACVLFYSATAQVLRAKAASLYSETCP